MIWEVGETKGSAGAIKVFGSEYSSTYVVLGLSVKTIDGDAVVVVVVDVVVVTVVVVDVVVVFVVVVDVVVAVVVVVVVEIASNSLYSETNV